MRSILLASASPVVHMRRNLLLIIVAGAAGAAAIIGLAAAPSTELAQTQESIPADEARLAPAIRSASGGTTPTDSRRLAAKPLRPKTSAAFEAGEEGYEPDPVVPRPEELKPLDSQGRPLRPEDIEDDPSTPLTPSEQRVLAMYDDMTVLFETAHEDCDALAAQLDAWVDEQGPVMVAYAKEQSRLPAEQVAASKERVGKAAGKRMASARQALRVGLARCAETSALRESLRKLAMMGAGLGQ
jgi:hypothetical protein